MKLTSKTPGRVAVVTLTIGLTVGLGVYFLPEKGPPVDRSESVVAARAATDGSLRPANASPMKYLPLQGARAKRPPKGTIHVRKRYIKHYRAKRATWNEVISGGKRLGKPSGQCAHRWRKSGKDRRLNWRSVKYLCMTGLKGRGYRPQGIAGSGTARRYNIGSTPAANRNIVLTSWYSRAREPGLFAPNRRGQSVTRLIVMDMGNGRYNRIELVRPAGRKKFRNMDSHGSGLAWAGQYLYMSSKSVLFMFNADDILKIHGRYVLPAVARWTVHGHGGLSSMSIDRSASRDQLRGINYTKSGPTYIQTLRLAKSGLLARGRGRGAHDLVVRNRWGQRGRVVRSVGSLTIPGASYQGVGSAGRYSFANSSALKARGGKRKVDSTAVFKGGRKIAKFQMPRRNIESIYIDYRRGTYASITESGSQFLFRMPIGRIIRKAER